MIKKIGIVVAILFVALAAFAALRPADYEISREVLIEASADKIFPYVNNGKKMDEWSPWVDFDPKAVISYSGPEEGVGSKASWTGGEKLGVGSATVVESVPNQFVKTKLEYVKPFEMTQDASFTLSSKGPTSTLVQWSVKGTSNFAGRLMCTFSFTNMDKMVGGIFEQGLAKLKMKMEN